MHGATHIKVISGLTVFHRAWLIYFNDRNETEGFHVL
jgi:hypothetical protein